MTTPPTGELGSSPATPLGREAIDTLRERQHVWANTTAGDFTPDEIWRCVELMRVLADRLEEAAHEDD